MRRAPPNPACFVKDVSISGTSPLPGISNRLFRRKKATSILASGYAEGFHEAELTPNSAFLQKPFRFATLLGQLKLVRRKA
jgi:hypothetical protein